MAILLDIFLAYLAVVFGLQHPDLGNGLAAVFTPSATPDDVRALGFFLTMAGFFLAIYVPRRILFQLDYDWGCVGYVIAVVVGFWLVFTALGKFVVYISGPIDDMLPMFLLGERLFDALVQFWFPAETKYFLHGILNQSIIKP